jgi:hypothetical protein
MLTSWLTLVATLLLSSCERDWHVAIAGFDGDNPEFCVSRSAECTGSGVQLTLMDIDEVDDHGNRLSVAGSIQAHSNEQQDYIIRRVVYGAVPKGWLQYQQPAPLHEESYYSINGEFYFRAVGRRIPHVYTREEFFKRHAP